MLQGQNLLFVPDLLDQYSLGKPDRACNVSEGKALDSALLQRGALVVFFLCLSAAHPPPLPKNPRLTLTWKSYSLKPLLKKSKVDATPTTPDLYSENASEPIDPPETPDLELFNISPSFPYFTPTKNLRRRVRRFKAPPPPVGNWKIPWQMTERFKVLLGNNQVWFVQRPNAKCPFQGDNHFVCGTFTLRELHSLVEDTA